MKKDSLKSSIANTGKNAPSQEFNFQPEGWITNLTRKRTSGPSMNAEASNLSAGQGMNTLAVHAGTTDDAATGAVGTPIYQNSTFILGPSQYEAVHMGTPRDQFIYSRYGGPNQWGVQEKIAALEGGESALVFSSGMAAISTTVLSLMDPGAHLVTAFDVYGGSYNFFNQELPAMGMSVSFVDPVNLEAIEKAIKPETQVLFFEILSNPLLKLIDLQGLVALAKKHQIRLIIDSTFASPVGCKPLAYGVDIVIHSASKYLNGHSDLIAGVATGSRKLIDWVWPRMLSFGGSLDPHACFLLERGLKTLPLRFKAISEGAAKVAEFLESHKLIKRVLHPSLASFPQFELSKTQLQHGGGIVTFMIDGTDEDSLELCNQLRLPRQATSLGGVESLVSLPFNTSHAALTTKQRKNIGIEEGCIRLSVGIEDPIDLIQDLSQALNSLT